MIPLQLHKMESALFSPEEQLVSSFQALPASSAWVSAQLPASLSSSAWRPSLTLQVALGTALAGPLAGT